MPYLKNLQDRLDKVEVSLEDIQLNLDTSISEEEKKIIITDNIIDEQLTEAIFGLREDLEEILRLTLSPSVDVSQFDSRTQQKIQELRILVEDFKQKLKADIIEELKAEISFKTPSKSPSTKKADAKPKKRTSKKGSKRKK